MTGSTEFIMNHEARTSKLVDLHLAFEAVANINTALRASQDSIGPILTVQQHIDYAEACVVMSKACTEVLGHILKLTEVMKEETKNEHE